MALGSLVSSECELLPDLIAAAAARGPLPLQTSPLGWSVPAGPLGGAWGGDPDPHPAAGTWHCPVLCRAQSCREHHPRVGLLLLPSSVPSSRSPGFWLPSARAALAQHLFSSKHLWFWRPQLCPMLDGRRSGFCPCQENARAWSQEVQAAWSGDREGWDAGKQRPEPEGSRDVLFCPIPSHPVPQDPAARPRRRSRV